MKTSFLVQGEVEICVFADYFVGGVLGYYLVAGREETLVWVGVGFECWRGGI